MGAWGEGMDIDDQMDEVWWSLTDEQQVVLNNE